MDNVGEAGGTGTRHHNASGPAVDVVIVAAGTGLRMGGIEKGLIPIAGRPALSWSLDVFAADPRVQRIALVVGAEQLVAYATLDWLPERVVTVVPGGATRAASVLAGVAALVDAPGVAGEVLLVHDAARPLLDAATLDRVIVATNADGAAIPVISIADTVKRVAAGEPRRSGGTVDRSELVAAQTPQGVAARHLDALIASLHDAREESTDEASLLEGLGIEVRLVEGDARLRKITVPSDVAVVSALAGAGRESAPTATLRALEARIAAARSGLRIGWGDDAHPVGGAGTLILGGETFPGSPALVGHSDGDVVFHAVADALLGAARLGDLGRIFPADDRTPQGVASGELLGNVRRRTSEAGLTPLWIDLTITAKSPRLAERLEAMGTSIAAALGMARESVSVKASTGNLIGDEGAGRAIRCQAILLAEQASD